MAKVTELEMRECILNTSSFTGSSAKGLNVDNDYLVYSYDTLIFRKSDNYFDNTKYSATTSKVQNILIDCFNLNNGKKIRDKKDDTMQKSDYKEAADNLRKAVINTEDALCWLDEAHDDRDKLNDLIDTMSELMKLYELRAELGA